MFLLLLNLTSLGYKSHQKIDPIEFRTAANIPAVK